MTGEEMERAIEFLLQSQASSETRIGRLEAAQEETNRQIAETNRQLAETNRQLAETNRQLDSFADTQAALLQVVTETFAAQSRINEDARRGFEELRRGQENLQRAQEAAWSVIHQLGARQDRTEASIDRLAETVRLHLEGGNGNTRG